MYYIKKGKKVVATSDPDEVTKENFVCEPGAENKVHCKLEKYEFDRETGEKKAVTNQVRADNPGDFERFAPIWKRQGMTITILHDPREGVEQNDVAAKLAKLNSAAESEEESRLKAEEEAKAKAEAESEARLKAEAEARLKAEEEAKAKSKEESNKAETNGKTK